MTRELARKKDRPRDIILRLTGSQKSQREYHLDEITRLNAEHEEITRRHNMEIEELTRLRTLRKHIILTCPLKLDVITIVQCNTRVDRGDCVKKNCLARRTLHDELFSSRERGVNLDKFLNHSLRAL